MPLYEYRCTQCRGVFEHLAPSSSSRPKACPTCGSKKLEKQFSTFSAGTASPELPSCASGSCGPDACAGGTCPFSRN